MNTEDVQAHLNTARDEIVAALRKFVELTNQPLIGNFEAYHLVDGRVDYRVTADSQILFKSNDSLDTPRNRVKVLEAYLACMARADVLFTAVAQDELRVLNEAFDEWRLKPTAFSFQTFANSAQAFGIRPALD